MLVIVSVLREESRVQVEEDEIFVQEVQLDGGEETRVTYEGRTKTSVYP